MAIEARKIPAPALPLNQTVAAKRSRVQNSVAPRETRGKRESQRVPSCVTISGERNQRNGAPIRSATTFFEYEERMSYITKNLISGETLAYRTGVHWSVLFWPVVMALALAAGGVACLIHGEQNFTIAGAALLVVAAVVLLVAIVKRNATEIGVTNRRVIIKTGIASRRSLEIMLAKVESVGIDEPVMGRMLGYGTVVIHGTGGTPEPFVKIAHPSELRKNVQEQVDAAR